MSGKERTTGPIIPWPPARTPEQCEPVSAGMVEWRRVDPNDPTEVYTRPRGRRTVRSKWLNEWLWWKD